MRMNEHSDEYVIEEEVVGIELNGIKKGRKQIKNKIQFNLSLNAEQKEVKANILKDTISVLTGKLVQVKHF